MARKAAKLKIRRSSKLAIALLAVMIFAMGLMLQNMSAQLAYARTLSSYGGCAMYGYAALTDQSLAVGAEVTEMWGK